MVGFLHHTGNISGSRREELLIDLTYCAERFFRADEERAERHDSIPLGLPSAARPPCIRPSAKRARGLSSLNVAKREARAKERAEAASRRVAETAKRERSLARAEAGRKEAGRKAREEKAAAKAAKKEAKQRRRREKLEAKAAEERERQRRREEKAKTSVTCEILDATAVARRSLRTAW
jgi:hypothetical protein